VSAWLPADTDTWGGRVVARHLSGAEPRGRVHVTGLIREVAPTWVGGAPALRCLLDDATGEMVLLFFGREHVAGMAPGAVCTVGGTAQPDRRREAGLKPVILNPLYRFENACGR
jgi:hypothetical protein